MELPKIISVDDHVVEPPHLWTTWLPAKLRERGPRVERRGIAGMKHIGRGQYEQAFDDDAPKADCWDAELAAAEVRRNAASGARAVAFSEIPPHLGLPSIHSGYWDPFFRACEETKTVVCMHIGSSSRMPATSPDAPVAVAAWLSFDNAMASLCDFLFLGGAGAVPDAEAGRLRGADRWLPYILERADDVWREHWAWAEVRTSSPSRDNVTFETDDPHTDSTWPDTKSIAEGYMAGLDDDTIFKVMRGNALRMLDRPQDWTAG